MVYFIKIDCKPGSIRPNNILAEVFTTLNIYINVPEKSYSSFGEWCFEFTNENEKKILKENEARIIKKISSFYPSIIRYAEWNFE